MATPREGIEPPITPQELSAFAKLARGLAVAGTQEELLGVLAHEVLGSLALERVAIHLVDGHRQVCRLAVAFGRAGGPVPGTEVPVGEGRVGRVAATGVAQLLAEQPPDEWPASAPVAAHAPGSALAVPILYDDQVLGVIDSTHHAPGFFNARHLEVFTAIARFAAPRLNVERLLAEMTRLKEFYEQVLDVLPAQIGVLSPSGVFEYVNPAAIADPEVRRWIVGKTNADYGARRGLPTEVVAQRVALQQQATRTGRPVEFDETFRTRDGELRRYYRYIAPIVDAQGTVQHLVSGGYDVTELRALQERAAATDRAAAEGRTADGHTAEGRTAEGRTTEGPPPA
ncbi:MAG: GAF domain-containing protein [Gemmatimonadetes bacterium]|nr:GAF domain-containing protein [Gemmatimonadota bacterium]